MFEPAKKIKKYLKVAIYGYTGTGKTRIALTFPEPAVIDTERGTDFLADQFAFLVEHTDSPDEIVNAVHQISRHSKGGSSAVLMLSDYTGPKPVESDPG